jgi:hypothetical protein
LRLSLWSRPALAPNKVLGRGSVSETATTSTAAISDSGVLLRGDGTVLQARGEEVLSYAWQESRDASGRPEPEADERVA